MIRPSLSSAAITALMLTVACATPDVVIRPGSRFSKKSTITLTAGSDNAIFKPELEKELIRSGFNIISDTVAQTISQEKKSGELKTAGLTASDEIIKKQATKTEGGEVIETTKSTIMKSEYVGKIEYLYRPGKHTVSRVNFTIIELSSGVVVASIGYEKSGSNMEVAREIVKQLENSISR